MGDSRVRRERRTLAKSERRASKEAVAVAEQPRSRFAFSLQRGVLGWPAVTIILLAFWIAMLASPARTSQTFDESVYATSGYTFWRFNDYRFNPENANLPQRLQALPLLFGSYKFIAPENELWRTADKWQLSWAWYYQLGDDAAEMIFRGRAASGVFAVALGLLVWGWSRQIFGASGRCFRSCFTS